MKTYKEYAEDIGGDLKSYASGDGSISFTWSRRNTSLGVTVTPTHIALWREEFHKFPELKILNKKSGAVLFSPVTRVDKQTLVLGNKVYTYRKDLEITAEDRYIVYSDGEPLHPGNTNTLAINFYLRNEKEILRQEKEGLY